MNLRDKVDKHGYAILPDVLTRDEVNWLSSKIESARNGENDASVKNSSGTYSLRNLIDVVPEVTNLVQLPTAAKIVADVLGNNAFMIRATLFDKTPGANWGVFWHQDLSIAVKERHDVTGFDAWTRKAGVQCVQPPADLMRQVLAVRFHLDDCTAENGALKVLPQTHRAEQLTTAEVEAQQTTTKEIICEVPAGGVILMRPLLLHASSPMEVATSRRVIHCEFAACELPPPLQWNYRIPVTLQTGKKS